MYQRLGHMNTTDIRPIIYRSHTDDCLDVFLPSMKTNENYSNHKLTYNVIETGRLNHIIKYTHLPTDRQTYILFDVY